MSALATALALLVSIWSGPNGAVLHPRVRQLGGLRYLSHVAANLEAASDLTGVPVSILAALAVAESGLDPSAHSTSSSGVMQINLSTSQGREWLQVCRLSPRDCQSANILIGARTLARWYAVCGDSSWGTAISGYTGLRCRHTPRSRHVLALAERIQAHVGAPAVAVAR